MKDESGQVVWSMERAAFKSPIMLKSVESQFQHDSKKDQKDYCNSKLKSLALKGIDQ